MSERSVFQIEEGNMSALPKVAQSWTYTQLVVPKVYEWFGLNHPGDERLRIGHNMWCDYDQLDER